MRIFIKFLISFIFFILFWWAIQYLTKTPSYILPSPYIVFLSILNNIELLTYHSLITFYEIIIGFLLGTILGLYTGILFIISKSTRKWLLPFIILTQAIPIFAIAPILTLWVGYGIWSKIIMTILIIYFPITIAFYDGLKRIDPMIVNLAKMMGASTLMMLFKIRIPFALPQLSSGLKLAAAFAPMGAVIGEWVGSSKGLGYIMLYASGRVQIDLMFASIIILAIFTIILYNLVTFITNKLTKWDPKSNIN
ncbi:MAG: ABC transporter permease [Pelagibacterales bacterium]|nr:ABC transporter permease [Pelagibacterales bacterium]|tara:strand:- start:1573 stop:2325 length:753 start_codon:yes stop_codon:yes gene_type:complete